MVFFQSMVDISMTFRIIIMIFLGIFYFYLVYLYNNAKKDNLMTKARYCLSFSFFFLALLINYIQAEINVQFGSTTDATQDVYPDMIPREFSNAGALGLFHAVDSDVFILVIFLLGTIPIVYTLEKYILGKEKPIITALGVIGLLLIGFFVASSFFLPNNIFLIVFNIIVPYGYFIIISLALFIVGMYLKLSINGPAEVRKTSLPIAIGFILMIVQLFITSTSDLIGHTIGLTGIILMFIGIIRMK